MNLFVTKIMKPVRWISVGAICLFVLLVVGLPPVSAEEESVGPKAVFKTTRVVVEKPILQGDPLEGVFEVTNEGDEVLQIVKVSPG